jgi:hypothetical protein
VAGIGHVIWAPTSNSDDREPDGVTARRIVQLIGEHKDNPFFIACGFRKPHLPWVDIYPSLTELCGLPPSPGMDGSSLAPLLEDPRRPWKKGAYTLVWRGENRFGRSVRTNATATGMDRKQGRRGALR